jgi:hypothetical protein
MFLKTAPSKTIRNLLAALTMPLVLGASGDGAQTRAFGHLYAFGDSYINTGPLFAQHQGTYPSKWVEPSLFKGGYYPLPWTLYQALGKPASGMDVYGWSGALLDRTNETPSEKMSNRPDLSQQLNNALAGIPGSLFSLPVPPVALTAEDVVIVSIGLHDVKNLSVKHKGSEDAILDQDGKGLAAKAALQMKRIIDKGAKTIVFNAFNGVDFVPNYFGVTSIVEPGIFKEGQTISKSFFESLKGQLSPLTEDGATIYLIDINTFFSQLHYDLDRGKQIPYSTTDISNLGTKKTLKDYFNACGPYEDVCLPGATTGSFYGVDTPEQYESAFANSYHPSAGGNTVLSQYIAAFLNDPSKLEPASTLITSAETLPTIVANKDKPIVVSSKGLYEGKNTSPDLNSYLRNQTPIWFVTSTDTGKDESYNTDVGQRVAYNHARATSPLVADVVSSRSDWGPKTYNIKTEKLKTAGSVIIYKNNDRPDPKITGPASLVIINPTVQVIK